MAAAAVVACLLGTFAAAASASSLFLIDGAGWGNDVGMGQWGAEGYALHGWGYRRILAHYYPHTAIVTVPDRPVRVLLLTGASRVTVGSSAPYLLVDARGLKVHRKAGKLALTTALRVGRLRLEGPIVVRAGAQPLSLDGRGYRGSLTLQPASGKLAVVNTVPLERYLRGVVPSEMPAGWQFQAYEAQAVAARSYALASLRPGARFDVYADNRSQVYGGIASEQPQTDAAVADTAGEALAYQGQVIKAYYDSSSGGETAAVQDVFPGATPEPYLVSVPDPYDTIAPYHRWRVALTSAQLSERLGIEVGDNLTVTHDGSGIASAVVVDGPQAERSLTGQQFASKLGLRSVRFTLSVACLDAAGEVRAGGRLRLHGFLSHIGGVVLQQQEPGGGWRQVARIRPASDGRFTAAVRPRATTSYRLAVDRIPGPPIRVAVTGRRQRQRQRR